MKALVTGGAGFIGSNLALELEAQGNEVIVLDNFSSGNNANLKGFTGKTIKADIREKEWFSETGKIETVFHQAALVDTTVSDKEVMFSVNVEGFKNVLEFALERNAVAVYASSAAVYGNGPAPMSESQSLQPTNVYGESKKAMDETALGFMEKHPELPLIGLRYFNVYGPNEGFKGKMASMVSKLAAEMAKRHRPRIFKHGEQKRDQVYVKDVVKANLLAAKSGKSTVLNCGTGKAVTFNELIEVLNKELEKELEPEYIDNPFPFYQNHTQADLRKARKVIGFEPDYQIEKGVKDFIKETGSLLFL